MTKLLLTFLFFLVLIIAKSQVNPYCFSQTTATYTAITGGTVLGTIANDDESFQGLPIGFTFNFKGTNFTQFCVNTNGYITLGAVDNGTSYLPISYANDNNIISALGTDLQAQTGSTLRYQTTGAAPNRILTVQWVNYSTYGETSNMNFQLRLLEGSNVIQFNYGAFTLTSTTFAYTEIGLRGFVPNPNDYNTIEIIEGTNTWATPQVLQSNLFSTCDLVGTTFKPASGLRYIWTPSTLTNVTTPPSFCPPSTVVLNATASSGIINWYNDPNTATVAGTGASFTTPSLSTSDTFYVAMNGCVTQRVPVFVNTSSTITSTYSFTQNSSTYTAITGGTILGTIFNDDDSFEALPIGFSFKFNGSTFTNFSVSSNGFIGLGTTLASSISPISSPYDNNLISVLGGDLQGQTGSSLRYVLSGTAPNRVLTVQWQNYSRYGETGISYNAQIKLLETSNIIQLIYGTITQPLGAFYGYEIGLSGNAADLTDFLGRSIIQSTNTWATSGNAATRSDAYGQFYENTFKPASGQRYIWTPLQINSSTPATICSGNTATISVTPSTGTASWFANPTGGASLATANSFTTPVLSTTTTYYAQLTGSLCPILPRTAVTVTVNPAPATPTVTAGGPTTFCAGGSVLLTSSAGTTYQWRLNGTPIGGATASTYSATAAGTYTVIVTNASGCQSAASAGTDVTVNALPATPTVTSGGPTTFCAGGSVLLTSSAGTTYQWSLNGTPIGGATASTYSATAAGTYTVIVTNASGCQSVASAGTVVTVNALPATPTVTAGGPTTFCAGGSVLLTSSAGTTYQWRLNGTPIGGATASTYSATAAGTYTVIVTNASGCQSTASAGTVVTVNPGPTITLGTQTNPTSCTLNNGSIQVNGTGTGNLSWTGTASGSLTSIALPTSITGLGGGAYNITFSSSEGCVSNTLNGSLSAPSAPAAPTITAGGPTTFCTGGSVTLTSSAGTTYLWSTGATTASITVSTAGSYSVSITNASGCSSPSSSATTVTVNALPATPTVTAGGPTTFCSGGSVLLTSSAGTTYQWRLNGTPIGGATASTYSATAAGTYTVIVTNASGCQSAASAGTVVTINALPATPTVTAGGPTTFCAGGSVLLTSSAGTTYQWRLNGTPIGGATASTYSATATGTYTVIVTNAFGCSSAASAGTVVTVNPGPTITLGTQTNPTSCTLNNGSIQVNGTGTGNLSWTGSASGSLTSITLPTSITGLGGGAYNITFTSAAGCVSNTLNGSLSAPSAPTAPTITAGGPTTFCTGGSVTLTSSAGTTYLWSTGATSASITVSTAGPYTVSITNASGCSSPSSVATTVTVNAFPATPTVTAGGPTTFCAGGSVLLTSSAGTTYQWRLNGTPIGGATASTYSATAAGTYTVIVTNASGCQSTASAGTVVTVNALPATPTVTAGGPTTFCSGGSVLLTSSAGLTYQWQLNGTNIPSSTSSSFTANSSGSYKVIVTEMGCSSISSATEVTVNSIPVQPTITANGPLTFCSGDSIVLTSSIESEYAWSTGDTTQSIIVSSSGVYSIQVLNVFGCQSVLSDETIVTVGDFTNPVFPILVDVSGECSVTLSIPTTTDNCAGIVSGTTITSFPITAQGLTIVTWVFDDGNGNSISVDQNVIINDVSAPIPDFSSLSQINATCSVESLTNPTATDNCSNSVIVSNNAVLPITQIGTTTITWSYTDEMGNVSTQTQDVTILPIIATVTESNNVLTSSLADSYQWIDCSINQIISGETGQVYVPVANGTYAVLISDGACNDTSECVVVNSIGLIETTLENEVIIYPNPTIDEVIVVFNSPNASIEIVDAKGKLIQVQEVKSGEKVSFNVYENGVYFLRVITNTSSTLHRVVKN
jgi:hypothetical protein